MKISKYKHNIELRIASSTGTPDSGGMKTCDMVLWIKYDDYPWFRPYGGFHQIQIKKMIDLCNNEYQLNSLMEML